MLSVRYRTKQYGRRSDSSKSHAPPTERRFAAMSVVAEAGIGKSRLLYEFEARSEARSESFFLFRGRAAPATGKQAYGLLRDILAWRHQIHDADRIEAAHDGLDLAEARAHLLGT